MTPPWGVPVTVSESTPTANTPALNHCRNGRTWAFAVT